MKTEPTTLNVLYYDNRLAELYETLDQLHSAASEGEWQKLTTMNKRELAAMLQDFVYTAQETLRELDAHDRKPNVVLCFVDPPLADKRQA